MQRRRGITTIHSPFRINEMWGPLLLSVVGVKPNNSNNSEVTITPVAIIARTKTVSCEELVEKYQSNKHIVKRVQTTVAVTILIKNKCGECVCNSGSPIFRTTIV